MLLRKRFSSLVRLESCSGTVTSLLAVKLISTRLTASQILSGMNLMLFPVKSTSLRAWMVKISSGISVSWLWIILMTWMSLNAQTLGSNLLGK